MTQSAIWPIPTSSPDPLSPVSPSDFATAIDDNFDAQLSQHRGVSRPAYAVAGTMWVDSATNQPYLYDGTTDLPVAVQVAVPATATSTGVVGQYAVESGFVYHCVATDVWERVAIATW